MMVAEQSEVFTNRHGLGDPRNSVLHFRILIRNFKTLCPGGCPPDAGTKVMHGTPDLPQIATRLTDAPLSYTSSCKVYLTKIATQQRPLFERHVADDVH